MDIKLEKIAHEKHLLSQGVDFKYLPNIQYNELENVYELIEWDEEYNEALNEINSSWCTWQAAKASAVPDGYVLVSDKPVAYMVQNKFWNGEFEVKLLNEMPNPEFEGDSYDVEIPLYMIEAAQEQGQ